MSAFIDSDEMTGRPRRLVRRLTTRPYWGRSSGPWSADSGPALLQRAPFLIGLRDLLAGSYRLCDPLLPGPLRAAEWVAVRAFAGFSLR